MQSSRRRIYKIELVVHLSFCLISNPVHAMHTSAKSGAKGNPIATPLICL